MKKPWKQKYEALLELIEEIVHLIDELILTSNCPNYIAKKLENVQLMIDEEVITEGEPDVGTIERQEDIHHYGSDDCFGSHPGVE